MRNNASVAPGRRRMQVKASENIQIPKTTLTTPCFEHLTAERYLSGCLRPRVDRLNLNGFDLEVVESEKDLGVMIANDTS